MNQKLEQFDSSLQINSNLENIFNNLDGAVNTCNKKLRDIIRTVDKQDVLVKAHEDFIRGKNSKVEKNLDGCNGDGNSVIQHVQPVKILYSCGDKYLVVLSPIHLVEESDDNNEDLQDS